MTISNSAKKFINTDKFQRYSWHINKSYRSNSFVISDNLLSSFRYAMKGISYTFNSQRNFRIHTFVAFLAIIFGVVIKLPFTSLAILTLTISSVLILELLNTSLEALVDLTVGRRYNLLARIAKDCAAASVLVASIGSFFIAILLFGPPALNYVFSLNS